MNVLHANGLEEKSDAWIDITDDFRDGCSKLDIGELLHGPNFGLYEAMSAFEMMDPKMDSGMVSLQNLKYPPKTLASCIDSGELKIDGFTSKEICEISDATFCAFISWIEGGSMAQTILANLYLHNPFLIEHRVLKAFCIGMLKLVDKTRDMITQTCVYEEEHFQPSAHGFQLAENVTPQRVSGMLKEAEDDLGKLIRSRKHSYNDEPESVIETEELSQVLLRIRLLKYLYLLVLNMKYEAICSVDDASSCLVKLKEILQGLKQAETFPALKTPLELAAFDVGATSRLLPPSFPRSIQFTAYSETLEFLVNIVHQVEMILSLPLGSGLIETMLFFDKISKHSPSIFVRSMLLYHYLPPSSKKVQNEIRLTDLIIEELKNFNCPPVVSSQYKQVLMFNDDVKLVFNAFLNSAARVMEGFLAAKCNTKSRQRERLAYLLEDLSSLQLEAERADAVIDSTLREKVGEKVAVQLSSGLGTWALFMTTRAMSMYLYLGMELELYDIREYCYVYWYLAEVLLLWNTSSLFRAESTLIELSHHDAKGKKKSKSKKPGSKISTNVHQGELLLARCQQHTARGLFKLLVALKLANLLPSKSDYPYDNEKVRFIHRFSPFAAVNFPHIVHYEAYMQSITPKDPVTLESIIDLLEQSGKNFQTVKSILEADQTKLSPECSSILTVSKNNIVVTRVLAGCLGKNQNRQIKFDFTIHKIFPVLKLS